MVFISRLFSLWIDTGRTRHLVIYVGPANSKDLSANGRFPRWRGSSHIFSAQSCIERGNDVCNITPWVYGRIHAFSKRTEDTRKFQRGATLRSARSYYIKMGVARVSPAEVL